MITCKRATELISRSMEKPLSLKESLSLKLHLFICEFCEQFARQIQIIRDALGGSAQSESGSSAVGPEMSKESKERLKKLVEQAKSE